MALGDAPWGGLSACAAGALLGLFAERSGREATLLRGVQRVSRLSDLSSLALPALVAVCGRAATQQPLRSENAPDVAAVLLESAAEHHFLKHNSSGEWVRDTALVSHSLRETPFYIEDGSDAKLWLIEAASASGMRLATVHDGFEPNARGALRSGLETLRGLRLLGTRTTERALPVGAALTAVGQAVHAADGTMQLRRPSGGRPWWVTTKTLDQLLDSLGATARVLRLLSLGFAGAGAVSIVAHFVRRVRAKRRAAELRRAAEEAVAERRRLREAGGEPDAVDDVAARHLCVICLEREHDAVFRDCGHLAACSQCAAKLAKCPICRGVGPVIRVYRA